MKTNFHKMDYFVTSIIITDKGTETGEVQAKDNFWAVHGIGQLIGWNFLVTIGYVAARFLKHYPWWLPLHFIGGTVPAMFSVGIIISAILKGKLLYYLLKKFK